MNDRTAAALFAAVIVAAAFTPAITAGQTGGAGDELFVRGQPDLLVETPDPTVVPGRTTELNLQVSNDGRVDLGAPTSRDIVTAARNVKVEVEPDEEDAPIEIETDRKSIGTVTESEPRTVPIAVTVPEGTDPGEYELDVELDYRYTSELQQAAGITRERSRTVTRTVEIEIDDSPRFDVVSTSTDAQIGDSGELEATVENVGGESASDVRLTLESSSAMLGFGGSQSDTSAVGSLDPGETTTVSYDIAVDSAASVRNFSLAGTARYEDPDGVAGVYEGITTSVRPAAEQEFAFEDVESSLRVGEEGEIRGVVRNVGPAPARSVVVRFADQSATVVPLESSVAVGTIQSGGESTFRLPVEMTEEAEAVPRNFDMSVAYRNEEDEQRLFEDIAVTADVAESRDAFLVDVEGDEVAAGSESLINVTVTNNLDEPVSDVEAKLFTDSPLGGGDNDGYIESLSPGETATVSFRVSADAGATPRTYPLQMDFRYDDAEGTSKLSDTYRTAIAVTAAESDGPPWLLVGGLVVLVVAGGAALYRRRRG